MTAAFAPWIACRQPNPQARLRLFCFPYAGTGPAIFRTWPARLPADVEVCAVQLPGRGTRFKEAPFVRLPPLVQALAQALIPFLDKKFAFFGHSLGALVGFELARRLRRVAGVEPARLFVSAARAPQLCPRARPIHALPDREFLAELSRLNGDAGKALDDAELRAIMLPVLRADFAVYETYVYAAEKPLDCLVSGFGGVDDHRVSRGDLDAWAEQTTAPFALRMFLGDHFFLNTAAPPLLRALSQDLRGDG